MTSPTGQRKRGWGSATFASPVCTVPGCERRALARDLCSMHYERWRNHNPNRQPRTSEDQFWTRIQRNGPEECWPWLAHHGELGYGVVRWDGKNARAHRIAWALVNGPIPAGLSILHSCDNPPCCNPAHLRPGTQADNIRDAIERRRFASGEDRATKLTAVAVREIRQRYARGESQRTLAREFGIDQSMVSLIHNRRIWKDA